MSSSIALLNSISLLISVVEMLNISYLAGNSFLNIAYIKLRLQTANDFLITSVRTVNRLREGHFCLSFRSHILSPFNGFQCNSTLMASYNNNLILNLVLSISKGKYLRVDGGLSKKPRKKI
jgi:hypothetical protein